MAVTTSNLTSTPRAWKQFTNRPELAAFQRELYAFHANAERLPVPKSVVVSTKKLRQMGLWAYARYCRNKGIDFIDCYVTIFGRMPRKV